MKFLDQEALSSTPKARVTGNCYIFDVLAFWGGLDRFPHILTLVKRFWKTRGKGRHVTKASQSTPKIHGFS